MAREQPGERWYERRINTSVGMTPSSFPPIDLEKLFSRYILKENKESRVLYHNFTGSGDITEINL